MLLIPNHPLLILSKEFAELCKPLELFEINHFTYQKQFNDGGRISLSNKPQWIEDYYNLNLYQTSLFEEKPSEYKAGFNVWVGEYDLEVYRHGREKYNTAHSITITEPHSDGCEHYLFSTAVDNQRAIHFLANNMDILYHFILYLKDRGQRIFNSAQKNKILIPKSSNITKNNSNLIDSGSYEKNMTFAKKQFFIQTPIHHYRFESGDDAGIKLTQREIRCIVYLLQNKTAEETAYLMNISRRTVESYLDNIKTKLDCDNKVDLIKKLKENKFISALA